MNFIVKSMARVTVEDCVEVIPSRFELVLLASEITRDRLSHLELSKNVRRSENENIHVTALRLIAAKKLSIENFREKLINKFRTHYQSEEFDGDEAEEDNELTELSQVAPPSEKDLDSFILDSDKDDDK